MIGELEALGIDPCGENGEFHTLVLNCPLFQQPIQVAATDPIQHQHYWFTHLTLVA